MLRYKTRANYYPRGFVEKNTHYSTRRERERERERDRAAQHPRACGAWRYISPKATDPGDRKEEAEEAPRKRELPGLRLTCKSLINVSAMRGAVVL